MRGQAGPLPFERMDKPWHIHGIIDQPNVADAHFFFGCCVNTFLEYFCMLVLVSAATDY